MKKIFTFYLLMLFNLININAQNSDIVKSDDITSVLHKSNIGKIYFSSKSIPQEELKMEDFMTDYKLTNKSNLYFVAFLGNSATNYLHRLDATLSADSLVKIGNYQFTLYIDDKQIYQSNLRPGAPYASLQHTATYINKPLINNQTTNGLWSESFWNRFLRSGGDSALSEGRHVLKMEIRTYLKTDVEKVGEVIASGSLNLNVERKPFIDVNKVELNPILPYNGFGISTAKMNGDKIKELKGSIEEGILKKINSVVVIKNGNILIEEYFNGEDRFSLHDPRSVGKSIASTMMGIAIQEKYIKSENQKLREFYNLNSFKNNSIYKENTTIKDLLSMSSGFEGNDSDDNSLGNEENMYPTEDWVKFTLDLPMRSKIQKNEWHYFTAGVVLLGDILDKKVKGGLEKYVDEKLFQPLGITKYKWQYTPQNVANTAGGLQMNALDYAKYGQLYKNGGKWHGKQILSKKWVSKTFTKYNSIPERSNEHYGYLFWNKTFEVKSKKYEANYCAGNGGNHVVIFKDLPLVIVITSSAYGQAYGHQQVQTIISDYILPSVVED